MKHILFLLVLALACPGMGNDAVRSAPSDLEGEYQPAGAGRITIARMGVTEELAQLMFVDWESGRYGMLAASGSDRLVSPPPARADAPWQTEIVVQRDAAGRVLGLTLTEQGQAAIKAERCRPWSDQDIAFSSGKILLSGSLRLPAAKGPLPAIVLVHGSGPGTRHQLSVMASFFARMGLAVLSYDKRGCGRSGGNWKQVDLEDLAADALAAVRWLRARPDIDGKRVGLWGISQGGWITPLAAAADPDIAFAINSSGPGTSLRRQDLHMMANMLKAHGLSGEEISLAIRMVSTLYDFGRGQATAEALDALSAQARRHPGLKDLALPPAREITPEALYSQQAIGDPAWFYHLDPDRDALAPYRRLRCPLLVTYGELDITVPVEESARLISDTLRAAGHSDFRIERLPATGHGFSRMQEGNPPAPMQPGRISSEFFGTIEKWLRERGFSQAPGK